MKEPNIITGLSAMNSSIKGFLVKANNAIPATTGATNAIHGSRGLSPA